MTDTSKQKINILQQIMLELIDFQILNTCSVECCNSGCKNKRNCEVTLEEILKLSKVWSVDL